ncbi:MAG: hypothetical protein HWQ38_08150 [Nostoc sp. NMS7]|uniref:hypothetical protein n=1 Tax=Nostoc sp. NMS7 TaxID=2815391 RepID=UPI0025D20AE3|nr:hypothetical protein [Nostoc sp. NMS7]MBN3946454.1 hypothetical protein [Nostoc sp. NMS7]
MKTITRLKTYLEIRKDTSNLKPKCSNKSKQCGGACIPRNHKCKLSSQQLNKFVEQVENKIKDLPNERAIALNPITGRILVSKRGDSTSVYLSPSDLQQMQGAIVTHNHPNLGWSKTDARSKGLSFSSSDVEVACRANMGEIKAVSSGYRHSLKPPSTGWNGEYWQRQVQPTYKKYEKQVYKESVTNILLGKTRIDQAEANYHHEVIKRTANQLGMTYSRKEIHGN